MQKRRRPALIKNFTIVARLRLSAFFALIAIVATCVTGFVGLRESNAGLEKSAVAMRAVLNQKQADMMHDAIRSDVLYAIQTGPGATAEYRATIVEALEEHVSMMNDALVAVETLPLDADIRADLEKVKPLITEYIAAATATTESALNTPGQGEARMKDFMKVFYAVEEAMGSLGDRIADRANTQDASVRANNVVLMQIMLGAGAAAALIVIVSNVMISRSITVPLNRVKVAVKEVAVGNLGGRYSSFDRASDLKDEVTEISVYLDVLRKRLHEAVAMEQKIRLTQEAQEQVVTALGTGLEALSAGNLTETLNEPFPEDYESLRANFNRTVEQLNQTMTRVVDVSRGIKARADEIRAATEDLSHRTENQAATLEETAAAIDELAASVRSAAAGAQEAEGIVREARTEAQNSGKVVMTAVEAMNGIEKSSEQISQIIGVIDDIAFQTNLLALNAGVEAARAGDAGRGFAVVASEVRALAQRSATASNEIKQLIGTSTQFVGRGVAAVGGAGKALTELVDRVSHISTLMSGIATGATEQASAVTEVNVGVTQLDQVAQRNAAMVQESTTTSQALQEDAIELERMVAQFTTRAQRPGLAAVGEGPSRANVASLAGARNGTLRRTH